MEQDSYQPPFYYNFDFTCLVSMHVQTLKRVPGYKETDPNTQFADNYPDNQVSFPALLDMKFRMLYAILTRELLYEEYSTKYGENVSLR